MAWHTEMIPILRVLIDDTDPDDKEYTDQRLKDLLVVAGRYVVQEIDFTTTYDVDIVPPNISPDPTGQTDGDVFTNFVTIKAACIIDRAPMRKRILMSGIEARCGPAIMKTLNHAKGFKELLELGYCGVYEEMKEQWTFGNANFCRAVISPFVNETFDPSDLSLMRGGHEGDHRSGHWYGYYERG